MNRDQQAANRGGACGPVPFVVAHGVPWILMHWRGHSKDMNSLATYTDIHSVESPDQADHIAFGRVKAPNGFDIMAYDVQPSKGYNPGENAFYITLQGDDTDEIKAHWDGLADGATTTLIPLAPAPFAPLYGMLTDRYGITWIVGVETPEDS